MADKSAIVSGAGLVASFVTNLMNAVRRTGGTDEDIHRLADPEKSRDTWDQIAAVIVKTGLFQPWKTIKLGTGPKTADDFRCALSESRFRISDWANDILGKFASTATAKEIEVDLVRLTVAELGFKSGARRDQIYDRAKELDLELCPAEVGPQLRLQYKDQPMGEWLLVAMEPITDSDGGLGVFDVEHDVDGLWLDSDCGGPVDLWDASNSWVFVRPRKVSS